MNRVETLIWVAGLLQLGIAAANLALPRILRYRESLARMSPMVREIFLVHAGYIVLVLIAFGTMSLIFAPDLAGGSQLGRFLSAFLAVFWLLRIPVQLGYDPAVRRKYRVFDVAFLVGLLYLGGTYLLAALEVGR